MHLILQPQHADNPHNICEAMTLRAAPHCSIEVHL